MGAKCTVAGSPEAFAAGILELAADAPLREQLGKNGRQLYKQTYNYTQYKARLAAVYQSITVSP